MRTETNKRSGFFRLSQRDKVIQPRVARNELPWVPAHMDSNPNGVVSLLRRPAATPVGLFAFGHVSQGSSFLATLGFEPESLWDSSLEFPKGITISPHYAPTAASTARFTAVFTS